MVQLRLAKMTCHSMEEKTTQSKFHWCTTRFYFNKAEDAKKIKNAIADDCGKDVPGSLVAWMCRYNGMHRMEMLRTRYDIGNLDTYKRVQECAW